MIAVFELVLSLLKTIAEGIANGESNAQIRLRIAAPGGVGEELIGAVRSRRSEINDYIKKG